MFVYTKKYANALLIRNTSLTLQKTKYRDYEYNDH